MKLTNKQLKKIIKEEIHTVLKEVYYRPPEFDVSDPKQYPEYEDKLGELYKNNPNQARELAGALDEPIDVSSPEWGEFPDTHRIGQDPMSIPRVEDIRNSIMEYIQFLHDGDISPNSFENFTNEDSLKSFGYAYGKEKEDLVRKGIRNIEIRDFFKIKGKLK